MKYAKEVIELMAVDPGKEFAMTQIVTFVVRHHLSERKTVHKGVERVLAQLKEMGVIVQTQTKKGRRGNCYIWQ